MNRVSAFNLRVGAGGAGRRETSAHPVPRRDQTGEEEVQGKLLFSVAVLLQVNYTDTCGYTVLAMCFFESYVPHEC